MFGISSVYTSPDTPNLQVLSRFMGLKRRAIAFSGRIPYFGGRFLTIEESSHAGSHGHGGTAAGRGRHPRGPAPLPVRDRRGSQAPPGLPPPPPLPHPPGRGGAGPPPYPPCRGGGGGGG